MQSSIVAEYRFALLTLSVITAKQIVSLNTAVTNGPWVALSSAVIKNRATISLIVTGVNAVVVGLSTVITTHTNGLRDSLRVWC
jgi:hypothetical protein